MNQTLKLIGRGFLLALCAFAGMALFIACLSYLADGKYIIGFGCLGAAVLALVVFGRLLSPRLDRLASEGQRRSVIGIALIATGFGVWDSAVHVELRAQAEEAGLPTIPKSEIHQPMNVNGESVSRPILTPVSKIHLRDDAMMIGVVAFGKAQAYLRRALAQGPASHVVNDLFGTHPVSVTYCDRTDRTRVFTADQSAPLEVTCGGWDAKQEMSLLVGAKRYAQPSQDIPLTDVPYVLTTWKAWRENYPGSLVYVGMTGPEELEEPSDVKIKWIIGLALIALGFGVWEQGQKLLLTVPNS